MLVQQSLLESVVDGEIRDVRSCRRDAASVTRESVPPAAAAAVAAAAVVAVITLLQTAMHGRMRANSWRDDEEEDYGSIRHCGSDEQQERSGLR